MCARKQYHPFISLFCISVALCAFSFHGFFCVYLVYIYSSSSGLYCGHLFSTMVEINWWSFQA